MAPKKKGKGKDAAAPADTTAAAADAAAPATAAAAAAAATDAKSAPAKDAQPKPWPMNPKAAKGDAAAPAAAAAADNKPKAVAATSAMSVGAKKAAGPVASEPKNDLKEEDIDRDKLESAMRRRQQVAGGAAAAATPSVTIDSRVAKAQRDKQRAWIASQEKELDELRDRTKRETEKSSDLALKVVIAVWLLIIAGIFFHVYRTIEQGSRPHAPAAVRNPNSADGSWTQRF